MQIKASATQSQFESPKQSRSEFEHLPPVPRVMKYTALLYSYLYNSIFTNPTEWRAQSFFQRNNHWDFYAHHIRWHSYINCKPRAWEKHTHMYIWILTCVLLHSISIWTLLQEQQRQTQQKKHLWWKGATRTAHLSQSCDKRSLGPLSAGGNMIEWWRSKQKWETEK
jgi:hypothetical protein